ncbi:MAG TPA: dTDP-glucose 4,6-dehydratase [Planctomycetota bacterium]|nr:dTDP-glucose 4,6-dehydratase [Planctomycetota bacterium]
MTDRFLVTGGCGFIGSNLVRLLLASRADAEVWNLDLVTYAGSGRNLDDLAGHPRYRFVKGDVCDLGGDAPLHDRVPAGGFRAVFHLAAESHVDRSTVEAVDFVRTNVLGTQSVVDWVRAGGARRLVHCSTDEVYGSLGPKGRFRETTPLAPNSPYAASKAASDLLVLAAVRTHGLDAVVTRCSNNYGPYQFPEKLIPLMLTNARDGQPLPVYVDGRQVRDWLHVEDHCSGLVAAADRGRAGEVYNFGGSAERENLSVVKAILEATGRPESLLRFVEDRPGHDRRYAMDASKARRELGWRPARRFDRGLRETVKWYLAHEPWWRALRSTGGFRAYYEAMYAKRIREGRSGAPA